MYFKNRTLNKNTVLPIYLSKTAANTGTSSKFTIKFTNINKLFKFFCKEIYINQENLLLTTDRETIGKLYKQQILHMISTIEDEGEKLVPIILLLFPEKKKNSRGKGYQFHFGFWRKNSLIYLLYETVESRNHFFRTFLAKTQHIWYYIAQLIKKDFKHEYDWYLERLMTNNLPYKFGIWECLAINYLLRSTTHRDFGDVRNGICVIVPAGKFTEGNLFLKEFNTVIEFERGDFFVLRSFEWYHENEKFVGQRTSYVLFTAM